MNTAYHITTTVLPGHKIEITAPELSEGEQVQVVVISTSAQGSARKPGPSGLDIIESLKGHRLFQTPEEVDRYINEERNSWDR
jgi:hypothetical protein